MPYADFVSGIFDLHGAAQGKRLVGDKTPHYVRSTDWTRDPVATAALWWEWQVRLGREAGVELGPQLYLEVRYDSLVNDPALDAKQAWRPVTRGLRDWRSEMPARELDRFEAAAGDLLEELGYPRGAPVPSDEAVESAARARRALAADIARRRHRRLPAGWAQARTTERTTPASSSATRS